MGLDMYAFSTAKDNPDDKVEIQYWRKHPNLHRWMEKKWRSRGGEGDFNCIELILSRDDINELERTIKANALPENEGGFFFGKTQPEDHELDLEFIERAKAALDAGRIISYDSWW